MPSDGACREPPARLPRGGGLCRRARAHTLDARFDDSLLLQGASLVKSAILSARAVRSVAERAAALAAVSETATAAWQAQELSEEARERSHD